MADIQKQNISVTPGSLHIEMSGGFVTAISGHPIAGGSGGGTQTEKYYGDNINVHIDYDSNTISLTPNTTALIYRDIPTKVSDLTDSASYPKKTYVDETFQTKENMSAYLTTANANETYQTKAGMDDYVKNEEFNEFKNDTESELRNKQYKLTYSYTTNGEISAIDSRPIYTGEGGVTGDYYSASNPSGFVNATQVNEQIVAKQYLTEASGNALYIPIPDGLSDNQYYAYTTSSWKVIQGAGDVSGISTVAHDDTLTGNGNQEALGVALSAIQSKLTDAQIQNISDVTVLKTASSTWDNVSAKLNTSDFNTYTATTAPATYQSKGDYATTALLDNVSGELKEQINTKLDKTFSSNFYPMNTNPSGYLTQETDWTNTIHEASAKAYNDATANSNSLYLTTAQYNTDSATFVTSSNASISAAGEQYALTTTGWAKVQAGQTLDAGSGISIDSNKINVTLGNNLKFLNSNNTVITTEDNLSASSFGVYTSENYYTKIDKNSITKYFKTGDEIDTVSLHSIGLQTTLTGPNRNISANYDANHLFFKSYDNNGEYSGNYSQIEMKVFQEQNPAETQHKSTIILTDYDGTNIKTGLIDVDSIAAWNAATGGSFTGVTTNDTLTGDGTGANNKLGVAWSALSSNTIDYSNSAFNLTNGTSVSSFDQISAAIDDRYSKSSSDERYVTTANVGSGLYYSGSSPKLGVKLGTDLAFNTNTSAIQINTDGSAWGAYAFVEGKNTSASGAGAHAEGADAGAFGQGSHAGGYGTHTTGIGNFIHGTFLNFASPDGTTVSNAPVFVGGTLNYTSAQNYNDHGGYLQIMGNGTYTGDGKGNNSDAYILYRDGTVSAKQFQNADGSETINGTTYNFSGVDNIEILPLAATANTANFPNDNVLRFILES